jgi:hypothetical protein
MSLRKLQRAGIAFTAVIGVVGVHAALAQGADSVTVDVGECVNLRSPEERFACYERHVEAASTAPAAAPAAPAAEPDRATGARGEPASDAAAPTAPRGEATEPQEFAATVSALRQIVPNSYVITLDNGQVWRQTYAEWYPLLPGQKVRIRPSRWGGTFWLTAEESKGYIQVKRVR